MKLLHRKSNFVHKLSKLSNSMDVTSLECFTFDRYNCREANCSSSPATSLLPLVAIFSPSQYSGSQRRFSGEIVYSLHCLVCAEFDRPPSTHVVLGGAWNYSITVSSSLFRDLLPHRPFSICVLPKLIVYRYIHKPLIPLGLPDGHLWTLQGRTSRISAHYYPTASVDLK